MITTDLFWIYIITTQVVWVLTFIVWEIKPLRPIRSPLLLISFFITTPPVTMFMIISWLISKLADKPKQKKEEEVPDTHEVKQDEETGLSLYSMNNYNVGDLVYVDGEQYRILSTPQPENGVIGYRVKRIEEGTNEETK